MMSLNAPGRVRHKGPPFAVIDIGSNSVRLVIFEALSRSPITFFNEKILCGLGKGVRKNHRLDPDTVERALQAVTRFAHLSRLYGIKKPCVVATSATRDSENGPDFLRRVKTITGVSPQLLSGEEEARMGALGVMSSFFNPEGVIGDQGGGSLQLIDVCGEQINSAVSFPLGVISLADLAKDNRFSVEKHLRDTLTPSLKMMKGKGKVFYAIGGTWRSMVKLHMRQRGYPLHVIHAYTLSATEALDFCRHIKTNDPDNIPGIDAVNDDRHEHLRYAAMAMEQILLGLKPFAVVFSAAGLREGLLYNQLSTEEREKDPLVEGARDLGLLRSRDPAHGDELVMWSGQFLQSLGIDETFAEARLRAAACYLADIGWRAHPDYRGEQSFNVIAHAPFSGVDHGGRAFLASCIYFRHDGVGSMDAIDPRLRELVSTRMMERARVLGGIMRVAFMLSAGMSGQLTRYTLSSTSKTVQLHVPLVESTVMGERLNNRLKRLAKLVGRQAELVFDET